MCGGQGTEIRTDWMGMGGCSSGQGEGRTAGRKGRGDGEAARDWNPAGGEN